MGKKKNNKNNRKNELSNVEVDDEENEAEINENESKQEVEIDNKIESKQEVEIDENINNKIESKQDVEIDDKNIINKVEEIAIIEDVKLEEIKTLSVEQLLQLSEEDNNKEENTEKNTSTTQSRTEIIVEKAQPYVKWAQTTCNTTVEVGMDLGKKLASQSVEYSKNITKVTHDGLVKASEFTNASIIKANDTIIKQKQRILRERKIIKNAEIRYKKLVRTTGSIELQVDPGAIIKVPYFVPKGRSIVWKIKVKSMQLGFGLNVRTQEIGGAVETEVESLINIDSKDHVLVGHRKASDIDRHLIFVFDNSVNKLLAKTCVYRIVQGDKAETDWKEYSDLLEKKEMEKKARGYDVEEVISDEEDIVDKKSLEVVKNEVIKEEKVEKEENAVNQSKSSSWFTNLYTSAQSTTTALSQKAQSVAKDVGSHPRVVGAIDYLKSTSLYKKYAVPPNSNTTNNTEQVVVENITDTGSSSSIPILPSSSTELLNSNTEVDGEEDKFVTIVAPVITKNDSTTTDKKLLNENNNTSTLLKMVQGATIDPDSFSSMWSDLELPDSVTIKLYVSPLEEFKYGFPIVSLASHLQNVGMYEVARGILPTGGGVKIFSYCEGYPSDNNISEYPIMFLLESICTKQTNDKNEEQWELIITMKCTDKGYLFDFMKFIQLKSLLSDINFIDTYQKLEYQNFLVNY